MKRPWVTLKSEVSVMSWYLDNRSRGLCQRKLCLKSCIKKSWRWRWLSLSKCKSFTTARLRTNSPRRQTFHHGSCYSKSVHWIIPLCCMPFISYQNICSVANLLIVFSPFFLWLHSALITRSSQFWSGKRVSTVLFLSSFVLFCFVFFFFYPTEQA